MHNNVIQLGMVVVLFLAIALFLLCFSNKEPDLDHLLKELRCVTCPNQNISDSSAPVASAMREEIIQRYRQGESTSSIRQYMLNNYGDYLSYRPAIKRQTYILWFTPILMLVVGMMIWFAFLNKGNYS